MTRLIVLLVGGLIIAPSAMRPNAQEAKGKYPVMAGIEQYRIADAAEEIALARSAAPASISADAEVLVLGSRGYESVVKGTNGFVCVVERSWAAGLDDPEFWNAKIRAPICFNEPAAHTVLPRYLERTKWVLEGQSNAQIRERVSAIVETKRFVYPERAAMCYMMAKGGYLNDMGKHWLPHLMFYLPRTDAPVLGGNLPGSPMLVRQGNPEPETVYLIPVREWSDGSPAVADHM